jgi:hypothetical protein
MAKNTKIFNTLTTFIALQNAPVVILYRIFNFTVPLILSYFLFTQFYELKLIRKSSLTEPSTEIHVLNDLQKNVKTAELNGAFYLNDLNDELHNPTSYDRKFNIKK